ncbi:TPA: hypothetical protein ACH3X1_007704 [Trebouxia sp. C0004]
MALTPQQLIGPCLDKIVDGASGRKYSKLRTDAKDLSSRLGSILEPQSARSAPVNAAAQFAMGPAANAWDGHVHVALVVDDQGHVQLKMQAEPVPASSAAAASSTSSLLSSAQSGSRGLKPESAQELLDVLRVSVETRKTQLVDAALDCVQRLISHGILSGPVQSINHRREAASKAAGARKQQADGDDDDMDPAAQGPMPPQAQAVELLCRCDDIPDDGIELRVLKGLLTAVTSNAVHVHGQALLLAVRTCYNIYLMSRSEVNQTTAKASLTQMLNVVFQRMEAGSEQVHVAPIIVSDVLGLPPVDTSSLSAFVQSFLHEVVTSADVFGIYMEGVQQHLDDAFANKGHPDASPHFPPAAAALFANSTLALPQSDAQASTQQTASEQGAARPPQVSAQVSEDAVSLSSATPQMQDAAASEAAAAPAAEHTAAELPEGPAQDAAAATAANGIPTAIVPTDDDVVVKAVTVPAAVPTNANAAEAAAPNGQSEAIANGPPPAAPSEKQPYQAPKLSATAQFQMEAALQKDAFLVFRALCKLSVRASETAAGTDMTAIRGKVLALELLMILLENSGEVFRTSEKFSSAIKQYLCLSLLKNCTSSIPQAFALSCSIFLTLMAKFRHSLKAEIGVFFPMIMLKAIEAPQVPAGTPFGSAPPQVDMAQRFVVIRCLRAQCESGQLLVDLFVNYDCDLEGQNLFERMVLALVRLAQGTVPQDATAQVIAEEQAMRLAALQCLVNILRSLVEWYTAGMPTEQTEQRVTSQSVGEDHVQSWENLTSTAPSQLFGEAPAEEGVEPGSPLRQTLRRDTSVLQSMMMSTGTLDMDVPAAIKDADSTREAQLLESWKAYKKGFQEGIALFNKKPKKGIAFMQEHNMLGRSPDEVAKFLAKTTGLNKTMVGEYLGEREDMCLKVMHAYVDAMNFSDAQFDEAIRTFLNGFRLPGEAQKIDRLMEKFAERFVNCNPEAFKSADVAYVLAYSVIMLNTDAHNPQVKVKMSQQDFLRNNRGINDGGDLPEEYMSSLYERIQTNEIKMKDPGSDPTALAASRAAQAGQGGGWMDTILNLIPGRKQKITDEPNEDAIKRTHDYLREKAKGATFFEATEGETVRPMLDVSWAPMLGAFSVLFEEFSEGPVVNLCLAGFVAAIRITSLLGMGMLRNTFVTSVCRFTMLHSPQSMQIKNAHAFRALLIVADENGNHMHNVWSEVLRCVSRWELLQQLHSGGPTDALLFSPPPAESPASNPLMKLRDRLLMRTPAPSRHFGGANGRVADSFTSIHDAPLHHTGGRGKGKDAAELAAPPDAVLAEIDQQELNRMFVRSDKLDSEAIVEFVRALCAIAQEELDPAHAPRVYGLTKIVEIAHFNMSRIRLVWNRIWAVLSDFFVNVCCHQNLNIAIYAVDSLRQLAMKFLERDELANYSFQNDFMKPFVIVMRQSKAVEIRELIIRCVSQMVLARVGNVKSGWKSMFMVFTTAAGDEQPTIVRLAFETIEKIVREHFDYITETEITTFTDCVNCLIAFTNNPHSIDVSLNAIAFLRFCAMKLAEGAIGDVELELPEGTPDFNSDMNRIRPSAGEPDQDTWVSNSRRTTVEGGLPTVPEGTLDGRTSHGSIKLLDSLSAEELAAAQQQQQMGLQGLQFSDKDEHMYFWFPLLAGLSELTFDPRPDIRYSALEVLFDTLKFHGSAFTLPFWTRIFDSVLLPIFDHVRAEVTDISTFTDDKKRAEVDAWLYETCTQCLQHIIDITVKFYPVVQPLLGRVLELLLNFIRRTHQSLASVGVAALVRLVTSAGSHMSSSMWQEAVDMIAQAASDTVPHVADLVTPPPRRQATTHSNRSDMQSPHASSPNGTSPQSQFGEERAEQTSARPSLDNSAEQPFRSAASDASGMGTPRTPTNGATTPTTSGQAGKAAASQWHQQPQWSLSEGAGSRRLGEVRTRAAIQLLLVQACGEIFHVHSRRLAPDAINGILDVVQQLADHARQVDKDMGLRCQLAAAQAHDKVVDSRRLADPPLMRLESEAGHAYLSMLLQLSASQTQKDQQAEVEGRLVTLALATLQRFQAQVPTAIEEQRLAAPQVLLISHKDELNMQAPLVVATLRAILGFSDAAFRRHLKEFFPILTQLISCEHAPAEVQRTLTEIFATRFGPLLQGN